MNPHVTRLKSQLDSLQGLERDIVWMLAVICQPVDIDRLASCMHTAVLPRKGDTSAEAKAVHSRLGRLKRKGLVVEWQQMYRCRPDILEMAARAACTAGVFGNFAAAVRRTIPVVRLWNGNCSFDSYDQAVREVRIALYSQQPRELNEALENTSRSFPLETNRLPPLYAICTSPFETDWFTSLPPEMQAAATYSILPVAGQLLTAQPELIHLIEGRMDGQHPIIRLFMADYYMLQGRIAQTHHLVDSLDMSPAHLRLGRLAYLKGDRDGAVETFRGALHELRSQMRNSKAFFETVSGLFCIFALVEQGTEASLAEAEQYAEIGVQESRWRETYGHLLHVIREAKGERGSLSLVSAQAVSVRRGDASLDLQTFFRFLFDFWMDPRSLEDAVPQIEDLYKRCREQGFDWVAAETAEILSHLKSDDAHWGAEAEKLRAPMAVRSLVPAVRILEPWRRALKDLAEVGAAGDPDVDGDHKYRLAWQLSWDENSSGLDAKPVEQRLNSKGKWTRGRTLPIKRLWRSDDRPSYLTEQDCRICDAVEMQTDAWNRHAENDSFTLNLDLAIPRLIGHPHLFWQKPSDSTVEMLEGTPQLVVVEQDGTLRISLLPDFSNGAKTVVIRETPTRLKVIRLSDEHIRMRAILGAGLDVPMEGAGLLRDAIDSLASHVVIQSDIASEKADTETREGDPIPHIHLLPAAEGLDVEMLVMPLGAQGPSCLPGKGGSTLICGGQSQRVEVKRDLMEEIARGERVIEACSVLLASQCVDWRWELESSEECLELLLQLKALDFPAVIEWPEGQKYSVTRLVSFEDLSLSISRKRDWFSVSGDVRVNEELTLSLSELVRLSASSAGRFIRIAEGQFVALTEAFKKKIEDLSNVTSLMKRDLRLNPFASAVIEDMTDSVAELDADGEWAKHLSRTAEAFSYNPELPSTLLAELRPYQHDGFVWLSRLAKWGAGACLADDMGLGKTVQALALILNHASEGPTLVVAPTSVCMNWAAETRRFAPTLRPHIFGQGDRGSMLRSLEPFDLVIASYGLMQSEVAALEKVYWQVIVLDEAQAIKNPRAKRSLAAIRLQGSFKLVTTGTPIENHLGELWSLFRFLNPGLLGTREQFMREVATPIERDADNEVRKRLKKLVQPFILRRAKSQVLEELPPRTDILHHVVLGEKERAFYEALRRRSVETLSSTDENAPQKRFKILAEITRLRQACCNPRLIVGDTRIPSAKLEAFDAILDELQDNRHKALVFSQFVRHLSLIREHLDARGVEYQYLDGSTPTKDRAARVEAFQKGQGDVFLISLKAGGTGLNLTAADYVIHMDPWWNPAVEDQASDRAYRIGQLRPVTIYRLVAENTIEDKIVELHQHKRDLADSLLEGTDVPSRITSDELMRLLAEQ